jgi:hypothetical protein
MHVAAHETFVLASLSASALLQRIDDPGVAQQT